VLLTHPIEAQPAYFTLASLSLPLVPLGLPIPVPPVVPELPLEPGVLDPLLPVPMPLPDVDPPTEPLVPVPVLLSAPVAPALPASMPLPYWLLELGLEGLDVLPPLWARAAPLATQVASPRAAAVTIANFLFAILIAIVECLPRFWFGGSTAQHGAWPAR
jgi:hypothetical protein